VRILHASDAHADWSTAGFRRFDDVSRAFEQTVRAAVDEKCGLYVFTGDLADPDGGSIVLRCAELALRVALELEGHDIYSVWVAGNHDVAEDGEGTTTLSPLKHHKRVFVFDGPGGVALPGGEQVVALPYPSMARPYPPTEVMMAANITERKKLKPCRATIVVTHLQLPGIVPGEETREMPRGRDVPFPWEVCDPSWLVLAGHYHERQVWEAPNGVRVNIAGSLARLTHGEERNRPSFQIWEV
jgi:DNA repair exonuclease SbcCD nuclease subunit